MLPVYYINRDIDSERRRFMEAELKRVGIEAKRIPGVEGYQVPCELRYLFNGSLTAGETGCAASHLVAALCIISFGQDSIVLEDDARILEGFSEVIKEAFKVLPEDWDIVKLCRSPKRAVAPIVDLSHGRRLVRYSRIPMGAAGYLISYAGAHKLLEPRKIINPIDVEIAEPWNLDLNVFGIDPPIVQQAGRTVLPSTIGPVRVRNRSAIPNPYRPIFNMMKLGPANYFRCLAANAIGRHL